MNCKVCGKENPDTVDLCISCGSTLPRSSGKATYAKAQKLKYQCYFREAWRRFVRSPLAIIFILCFSAGMLCGWFEKYAEILRAEMALGSMSIWSLSWLPYRKVILAAFHIIGMLPSTLTAVGLWMIFADTWKKPDHPIHPGGLKLILIVHVVSMVILGILFCIMLAISGRTFLAVLVVAGLTMALYWLIVAMIITARNSSQYCVPNTNYAKALAVIQFISAGLDILNIFSGKTEMTLGCILDCVMMVVLGAVLLKFKELMEDLNAKCVEMEAQSEEEPVQEQNANNYVPAWKRVQMENETPKSDP